MEPDQHEDLKGLSNESDVPDQVNDNTGTRRFYECMFCKQGFTTAQALGGHMNIHRRDRARIRQPTIPSVSNQPREDYATPEVPPPISNHPLCYSPGQATSSNYPLYFPPNPHPYHTHDSCTQKPHPLSLFEDDGFTNLSLQIGPTTGIDNKEEEKKHDEEEDELDLELRLGHDP